TINGYFSFEFEDHISGDEHWRSDEHASFDSDMIDIVLNVHPTDRLRLAVDFTWEHGSQSEINKGNVGYEYAFAEYILSDKLRIRAGKMFTPFGIYNEIHTAKPSTIILKEPNPTNKIYFTTNWKDINGNPTYEQTMLYPRWGSGVAMLGNSSIADIPIDYIVQVTNGDLSYGVSENEYDKDDNNQKAVTARVRVDLTDDLQIGASIYHDKMTRYDSNDNPVGNMIVDTQGAQLIWHINDDIRLEMEYVSGILDVEGIKKFRRSGYSILPSYFISDKANLYFLYAKADPNHNVADNSVINYAPGVNIEVDDNMFIKIDYFNVVSQKNNTLFYGKDYSEIRAALAIGF
ncbi:MAG: OprO/OprP family phosphate-selective porin, partial [Thiovulaceae bacterium]|nr:OprO/OprP family phosphate-selective porin [Sulfurimonadaceae bacterium]